MSEKSSAKESLKLKPLGDRVIVDREESGERTKGGIVLPDTAKEKPKQGVVIAVGDGKILESGKRVALQVKAGDRILFTSYAGNEVKVGAKDYLIMTEEDILAILD